ncbi:class I tRNA ligase family protein, partial [bacterium]|nr:class I tRNA ligase family protein [bacterium]
EKCDSRNIRQEEDILDTWFSSALWPFSTMGWPEETADLKRYYPTKVLLTAHEIIFFWVARMIIMGLKFMGDVPFRDVYIHPMVFDEKTRKKMSKSLGNIIDPLEMIEKYGADAVRMTVCAYAVKGSNLYLSEERFEGYGNFMNKFWNSARFVLMNTEDLPAAGLAEGIDPNALEIEDRWILGALAETIRKVNESLGNYEFDQYVHHLYHYIWGEYCDWYLELVKGRLYAKGDTAEDAASRRNAQVVLLTVLEALCRLLQPVAPFIAEEIWQNLRDRYGAGGAMSESFGRESVMIAPWPDTGSFPAQDETERARMDLLMNVIGAIRKIRSEMGVQPSQSVDVVLAGGQGDDLVFLETNKRHIEAMARVGGLAFQPGEATAGTEGGLSSTAVAGAVTIHVELPAEMIQAERERLAKELEKLENLLQKTQTKLSNPSFVEKAPEKVVNAEKERLEQARQQCDVLRKRLDELTGK